MSRPEENICAVVVTYNPGRGLENNLAALAAQAPNIVIVDNASRPEGLAIVRQGSMSVKAHLILNHENLGIAAALNQGIKYAISNGFSWVATFDQDSSITPSFFVDLLKTAREAENFNKLAFIAPCFVDESTGIIARSASNYFIASEEKDFGVVSLTISSGNLIPISTFNVVGLFDEWLFIDYVDFDFCFRCAAHGLFVVEAKNVLLRHNPGKSTLHKVVFLKKKISTSNHSLFRRYFMARNRIILYKRYFFSQFNWCLRDAKNFTKEILKIIFFEDDKSGKLFSSFRGGVHGLLGIGGQAPEDLRKSEIVPKKYSP